MSDCICVAGPWRMVRNWRCHLCQIRHAAFPGRRCERTSSGGTIFEVLSGRRAARLPVVNILQRTSWVSSDRSQGTMCASCL